MTEVWRPVVGYERLYEVSDLGRVRSFIDPRKSNPEGIKSISQAFTSMHRYQQVGLRKNGKSINRAVHIIVAEAFLGPRPGGLVVDHIDGNPGNNAAKNLRYCTPAENSRSGRGAKLTLSDAQEIRHLYASGDKTQTEIASLYDVTATNIRHIVNARRWADSNIQPIRTGRRYQGGKLTADDLRAIHADRAAGVSLRVLASSYGVAESTISRAIRRSVAELFPEPEAVGQEAIQE